ncbi:MAG: stage IV sporulation protein A [Hespellia sp.]|nr:stage IV sporulation protein A [Hespellia sp.]
MDTFEVYKDMKARTNGEIYLGVVGPVRTGKSTFIKRFMDLLVLPNIADEHSRKRTRDELPQSSGGTTIMTTEPKFIPKDSVTIRLPGDLEAKIKLIDCVGYMVEGATGHLENGEERQVKTPWFDYEIPFTKAATIGTQKVIHDHATIGLVMTCDGSFGELERASFVEAEEKTIRELKEIGKPFVVILNTEKPYSDETKALAAELEEKYGVKVLPLSVVQLTQDEIHQIIESILLEFPITEVDFFVPKWIEMLSMEHPMKKDLLIQIKAIMKNLKNINSIIQGSLATDSEFIEKIQLETIHMDSGQVEIKINYQPDFYYQVLSELTGTTISGEYDLISMIKEMAEKKNTLDQIKDAFTSVKYKGYGVVTPMKEEILLEDPVVIKQGNKYGVKIHSEAPSIHMIRANIQTDIAPIVGSEQQADDLVDYIKKESESPGGVWSTNIFGKSVEDLVMDGMRNKIASINDESQMKLQDTMQKIVNENNGGLVCIII